MPSILGPLFWFDLTRSARRSTFFWLRFIYALFLFASMIVVFSFWFEEFIREKVPTRVLGEFTASFFVAFLSIQLIVVLFLTPPFTAGAIAEEKERGTLDALLASGLGSTEIVVALWLARMARLVGLILVGLPILAILQLLGGLDPSLVLAGFALSLLTLYGLSGLSLLLSLHAKRPREAIFQTNLMLAIYLALTSMAYILLIPQLGLADWPTRPGWRSPVTLTDVVNWCASGNPFAVAGHVAHQYGLNVPLADCVPSLLAGYAIFHGVLGTACVLWCIFRLRAVLQPPEASQGIYLRPGITRRSWLLGWRPVLWKELGLESSSRWTWLRRLFLGMVLAVLFLPLLHLIFFYGGIWPGRSPANRSLDFLNLWARAFMSVLGFASLVQCAFRASGAITMERDHQTIDCLLMTRLTNREILIDKWLSCVFSPRIPLLILFGTGCLAAAMNAIYPPMLLAWWFCWLVLAGFFSVVGLWFSIASYSSRVVTVLTLVALLAIHAVAFLVYVNMSDGQQTRLRAYTIFPPFLLYQLPCRPIEISSWLAGLELESPPLGLISVELLLWLGLTGLMLLLCHVRFTVRTGREGERPQADPWLGIHLGVKTWLRSLSWPHWPILRRRILHSLCLAMPISCLAGYYLLANQKAEAELGSYLKKLAERGESEDFFETLRMRAPIPAEKDSGPLVTTLSKQIPEDWPEYKQLEQLTQNMQLERVLRAEQYDYLVSQLDKLAHTLKLTAPLADKPIGRLKIVYGDDLFLTNLSVVQDVRRLGSFLQLAAWRAIHEGRSDDALAIAGSMRHAARAVGDDPFLISQLVRIAIESMSVGVIERALAQGQPSEAALLRVQSTIDGLPNDKVYRYCLMGERAVMDSVFKRMQTNNIGWLGTSKASCGLPALPQNEEAAMLLSGSLASQRLMALEVSSELIATMDLPPGEREAEMTKIQNRAVNGLWSLRMLMPAVNRVWQAFTRDDADRACLKVAIAAERFRLATGRWPESMNEMVPAYLAAIPADPFDGKPLRYGKHEQGVKVWSIGADNIDNGGAINRGKMGQAGMDQGLRLFDPVYRRQEPPPPPKPDVADPVIWQALEAIPW